ncbi:MAG: 30S ribosomal protein S9, partial [Pirellulaceae bacterium]
MSTVDENVESSDAPNDDTLNEEHVEATATAETTDAPRTVVITHRAKKDPKTGEILGTGRRKSSVARVRLIAGSGKLLINDREVKVFFPNLQDQNAVLAPLQDSGYFGKVDVRIRVEGGGPSGQSGACRMGLGRALVSLDETVAATLKDQGHLT